MPNKTVYFIMGVSGSGKSTIGKLLAKKLTIPFFDADDYHSDNNIQKMTSGIPLTDADRTHWLHDLNLLAVKQNNGAVIACSALKEKYRVHLIKGIQKQYFIFLNGSFELISERLKNRGAHFMSADLLQSQFNSLEIPTNGITVDINNTTEEIVNAILEKSNRTD